MKTTSQERIFQQHTMDMSYIAKFIYNVNDNAGNYNIPSHKDEDHLGNTGVNIETRVLSAIESFFIFLCFSLCNQHWFIRRCFDLRNG